VSYVLLTFFQERSIRNQLTSSPLPNESISCLADDALFFSDAEPSALVGVAAYNFIKQSSIYCNHNL
jgi:hypothetical protein